MAELAEDVESLPPCVTRGIDVPVVTVDIAKEGERLRLTFGFAGLPVQVAGLLNRRWLGAGPRGSGGCRRRCPWCMRRPRCRPVPEASRGPVGTGEGPAGSHRAWHETSRYR